MKHDFILTTRHSFIMRATWRLTNPLPPRAPRWQTGYVAPLRSKPLSNITEKSLLLESGVLPQCRLERTAMPSPTSLRGGGVGFPHRGNWGLARGEIQKGAQSKCWITQPRWVETRSPRGLARVLWDPEAIRCQQAINHEHVEIGAVAERIKRTGCRPVVTSEAKERRKCRRTKRVAVVRQPQLRAAFKHGHSSSRIATDSLVTVFDPRKRLPLIRSSSLCFSEIALPPTVIKAMLHREPLRAGRCAPSSEYPWLPSYEVRTASWQRGNRALRAQFAGLCDSRFAFTP